MKYVIKMATGGTIYIIGFKKNGSGVQKLVVGIWIHIHTQTQRETARRYRKPSFIAK